MSAPSRHLSVGPAGMVVVMRPGALKAAAASRGWSLTELSRRARISRPTLALALRGHAVRPITAHKICRALDAGTMANHWDEIVGPL
jgi:DNA-binding Xre family transcriptional regulator